jgi:hypothetical protein
LFGLTDVKLTGGASTDSYTGTYDPATATAASTVGSNGDITVSGSGSTIFGSAAAGGSVTTNGGASVTGSASNGASPQPFPLVTACSPYSSTTGITPASSYTPSDGKLKESGGGTLTLAPGTYCFSEVDLTGNSTLVISGATTINLTGDWKSTGGTISNTTHLPSNLKINSSGSKVEMTGGTDTYVIIYAPAADVKLSGNSSFFGSAIGDKIDVSGGAQFHQSLGVGAAAVANWHEVQQ